MGTENGVDCRTYQLRYVILAILSLTSLLQFFQIQEYPSIADVLIKYYNESYESVNFIGVMPNIEGVLFFYPVGKFVEKFGLRLTMLVTALFNCLGSIIKCMAINPSLYPLLVFGNALAIFPPFALFACLPVLASTWFTTEESPLVFGVGSAAHTVGFVIAFFLPSIVAETTSTSNGIQQTLSWITIIPAIISVLMLILVLFIIKEKPEIPPSLAERRKSNSGQRLPLRTLLTNKNAVIISVCFSLTNGTFQLINVTLNQSVLTSFANNSTTLTIVGTLLCISGIPGSCLTGLSLSKFSNYRTHHRILATLLSLSFSIYVIGLWLENRVELFISTFLIGYMSLAMNVLFMDYLVEVTYPFPESVSIVFMVIGSMLFGIAFVPLITKLTSVYGAVIANSFLIPVSLVNVILSFFIEEDLRRKMANEETQAIISNHSGQ